LAFFAKIGVFREKYLKYGVLQNGLRKPM
jgi:hypothetical protein